MKDSYYSWYILHTNLSNITNVTLPSENAAIIYMFENKMLAAVENNPF